MSIDTIEREHQHISEKLNDLQLLEAVMKGVLTRQNTPEEATAALRQAAENTDSKLRLWGGLSSAEDAVLFSPTEDVTYHPTGIVGPWFEVRSQAIEGAVTVLLVPGVDLRISGKLILDNQA